MFKNRKVVIVGAGHVGSHVALALIQSGDIEIDGKGCTEFGIANAAVMIISAIFHD